MQPKIKQIPIFFEFDYEKLVGYIQVDEVTAKLLAKGMVLRPAISFPLNGSIEPELAGIGVVEDKQLQQDIREQTLVEIERFNRNVEEKAHGNKM